MDAKQSNSPVKELEDDLEMAWAFVDAAGLWLRRYGKHDRSCGFYPLAKKADCDCGLKDAIRVLEEAGY